MRARILEPPHYRLSPSLSLLFLLLSPHILEILPPSDLGTASFLHHDAGELVVLHGPVIEVLLIPVAPLVVIENFPDLCADVNLGVRVVDEVVHLAVVLLLTVAVKPSPIVASAGLPLLPREGAGGDTVDVSGAPAGHLRLHLLHLPLHVIVLLLHLLHLLLLLLLPSPLLLLLKLFPFELVHLPLVLGSLPLVVIRNFLSLLQL